MLIVSWGFTFLPAPKRKVTVGLNQQGFTSLHHRSLGSAFLPSKRSQPTLPYSASALPRRALTGNGPYPLQRVSVGSKGILASKANTEFVRLLSLASSTIKSWLQTPAFGSRLLTSSS